MSVYANYTKAQLQQLLIEAQDAYHKLVTGQKAITINRAGRSVTFSQTTRLDLANYIEELKSAIGLGHNNLGRFSAGVNF